jgi:hypothetical protein
MKSSRSSRANGNNHSNQLNPNNPAYWSSRSQPAPGTTNATGSGTRVTPVPDQRGAADVAAPDEGKR